MQPRLRLSIALLLLLAAGIHPLVHVAAQDCPCVHGAAVTLAAPAVAPAEPAVAGHSAYVPHFATAMFAGDLPARAPPAV